MTSSTPTTNPLTEDQIESVRTDFERVWLSIYGIPDGLIRWGIGPDYFRPTNTTFGEYKLNHAQVAWEVWLEGAKERAAQ